MFFSNRHGTADLGYKRLRKGERLVIRQDRHSGQEGEDKRKQKLRYPPEEWLNAVQDKCWLGGRQRSIGRGK